MYGVCGNPEILNLLLLNSWIILYCMYGSMSEIDQTPDTLLHVWK